jgi:hypothetical protein
MGDWMRESTAVVNRRANLKQILEANRIALDTQRTVNKFEIRIESN